MISGQGRPGGAFVLRERESGLEGSGSSGRSAGRRYGTGSPEGVPVWGAAGRVPQ
jgi:hypothetical protein